MKAYFIIVCILSLGCQSVQKDHFPNLCSMDTFSHNVEKVALKDTIRIQKLNGNFVEMEGILRYNFEDVALYPTKHSSFTEAIWLNLIIPATIPEQQVQRMDGYRVVVIGKINTSSKGHLGAYIATLDSACIKVKS